MDKKQHGIYLEPPGYRHVSRWFPFGKNGYSMWFPTKETLYAPVSQIPLLGNQGETCGFHKENRGNFIETTGFQRETWGKPQWNHGFPIGNYMETPGFISETWGKSHGNLKFPKSKHKWNYVETLRLVENYCAPVSGISKCGNFMETLCFFIRKSVGNHKETPGFLKSFRR